MKLFLCLLTLLNPIAGGNLQEKLSLKTLSDFADDTGADKGKSSHNYVVYYEKLLKKFRNKKIKFLEIGFYHGASARMWDSYFSKESELHFIEISPDSLNYFDGLSSRCFLHIANQEKVDDLHAFLTKVGGDFDVIIDDGGHSMNQQITSFNVLFPHVKAKGIYVIEDLHTSYWVDSGAHSAVSLDEMLYSKSFAMVPYPKNSTVSYLFNLASNLNYFGARANCADQDKFPHHWQNELDYFTQNIESLSFFPSICFIFKK